MKTNNTKDIAIVFMLTICSALTFFKYNSIYANSGGGGFCSSGEMISCSYNYVFKKHECPGAPTPLESDCKIESLYFCKKGLKRK